MGDFHVLSKPGCPNCDRAKRAISMKGFRYSERVYSTPEEIESFREQGYRSFPMVFRGQELIGTADQTIAYLNSLDDDF